MKYRAGISGEEYAAMEDGYEQGRVAERAALEAAGWVSPDEHAAALSQVLEEFGAFLIEKAEAAEGRMAEGTTYSDGMRNAAIDATLFLGFRERWLAERLPEDRIIVGSEAGITAPHCASWECERGGFVKSERWGAYLCPEHALTGPVKKPE